MIETLLETPLWVIPGMILGLTAIISGIFGAGKLWERRNTNVVTHPQLRKAMSECQNNQSMNNNEISKGVLELVQERKEIWDMVRNVDKRTAIIETNIEWITENMKKMKA